MPLKYVPKLLLILKLPDGTTHQAFYRQSMKLADVINTVWPKGKTKLNQNKTLAELGLKNDSIIVVSKGR